MTDGLDQVIKHLEKGSNRIDINHQLFTRFVDGSSDEVLKALESQMNAILDDYDSFLINAFEEINTLLKAQYEAIKTLSEQKCTCTCRKEGTLVTNTR